MNKLLIEIGTEELPASVIQPVGEYLRQEVSQILKPTKEELLFTPRRIALILEGFEDKSEEKEEIILGPPKKACYDENNNPTRALIGFLQKHSARPEDLIEVESKGGLYVAIRRFLSTPKPTQILLESFEDILLKAPLPKSMRWTSSHRIRFSRPIRWLCALYNEGVFPIRFGRLTAGNRTKGHRFLSDGWLEVNHPDQYKDKLLSAYVIPDYRERLRLITFQVEETAKKLNGEPDAPEGLYEEVANLVEYPFVVFGEIDRKFLDLPDRVIITVLAHHQRFFCVRGKDGLLPYFIAVSNNRPVDGRILKGYQKVIRARLEDALFFYGEDLKVRLEELVPKLSEVLFHPKAGSMLDKTQRLMGLVEKLCDLLGLDEDTREKARRSAYLSKADLLTQMVRELDELQGYMGYVYAKAQGEEEEVALALWEQYMSNPTNLLGKLLALADRLDSLYTLISAGEMPTSSSDPYALRRSAQTVFNILEKNHWDINIKELFPQPPQALTDFLKSRLRAHLEPYPYDVVSAVLEVCDPYRPYHCMSLVKRIANLKEEEKFKDIVQAYRRVLKILPKDLEAQEVREELMREEAEMRLWQKVKALEGCCSDIIDLYALKEDIDEFFDSVLVMDKDEGIRNNRLSLLARIKELFNRYADFNKLVYEE